MTRILADLSEEDVQWLDAQAAAQGTSRAQLLRDAVAAFRADASKQGIEKYFGMWRERREVGDPVAWQRRERASWTRPWDPDYWDVRKEFPDLFDADDDREAERYRKKDGS
ncbi:MAG: hypothetical protein Pars92KO_09680 [Parasphingorhabdus sp.]